MFTLTIYFIVLNVFVEFVLIYRPHPVLFSQECLLWCVPWILLTAGGLVPSRRFHRRIIFIAETKKGSISYDTQIDVAKVKGQLQASVADPHHIDPDPAYYFDTDPDPAFRFDADPDPAFYFDAGPDPAFHFDANPDPAFHFDADPESAFLYDADPDPTFPSDADPDPTFHFDSDLDPDQDPTCQLEVDPDPTTHFFPDLNPQCSKCSNASTF